MQFGRGCPLWGRVCPFLALLLAGDGPACSLLALLWYCSVLCSVNGLAVFWVRAFRRLILSLFLSLAIPQFRLLSHISSLRLPSGHSGPVLMLSNAAHSSPFSSHLLVVNASVWGTFLLGVAFRHVICGGLFIYFSPQLGCSLRFKNFPQTHR